MPRRRRKLKKKWIKPHVCAVELNHNQAIIAVCIIGGVYFSAFPTIRCFLMGAGGTRVTCLQTTVRGNRSSTGNIASVSSNTDSAGS